LFDGPLVYFGEKDTLHQLITHGEDQILGYLTNGKIGAKN
jgi:hypothetical protein